MSELAARQEALLRAVIIEYIGAAEPVGSEMLVQKYDLGVKSATVRNELAEMSELGYLEQPHTSAGRIPSDRGYRYFVDHLIVHTDPKAPEKQSLASAAEEGEVLQNVLFDTTATLSRLTHLLSAATVLRDGGILVRSAILSALGPTQALLVMVLGNGHVASRVIECPAGMTLEDVGAANEALSKAVVGKPLRALPRFKFGSEPIGEALAKLQVQLASAVRAIARERTRGQLVTHGEEFLFGQPEFRRDADALAELLDGLKSTDTLFEALSGPVDQSGTVTIGKEHRSPALRRFSVVRQSFFVGSNEAGTIALIGPTRMHYESSIPFVDFTAKALSDALTRYFG